MKKKLYNIIAVALAAIICVGFTSCSKDDDNKEKNPGLIISGKWCNIKLDNGFIYDSRYGFEFNRDGTYSYIDPNRSFSGNYRVFESLESTGVLSYTGWDGNEHAWEYDGILRKMHATGTNDFDQIWMYIVGNYMIIHLYSSDKFVENLNMFYGN